MNRTVYCHGSVPMCIGIPDEDTDATREGNAVHWVGESMLRSMKDNKGELKIHSLDYVDKTAPNGVVITDEMYDAALTYYNEVMSIAGKGLLRSLEIEKFVQMPEVHDQNAGTLDAGLFDAGKNILYVWDLKYGHGSVNAVDNYQLIDYALGMLREITNGQPLQDFGITVKFCIVQPRCYDGLGPYRRWTIPAVDLRAYVNIMHVACETSLSPDARCVTGEHCNHCPASHICPSLLAANAHFIDYSRSVVPVILSPEALAYEKEKLDVAIKLMQQRQDAIDLDMLSRIEKGEQVPGYAREQSLTNNNWIVPEKDVITTGTLMGVDLRAPEKSLTPTKAIELLKKSNIDPQVIKPYYGRSFSKFRLVKDDNTKARQLFSQEKI